MASIFSRLFKIFQSEAHSAVDDLEDPIKMTEQGVRDLKKNLHEALASLAQVKAVAIRLKKDSEEQKQLAGEYERKAMLLLQRMKDGELEQAEAESLATQALAKKEDAAQRSGTIFKDFEAQQKAADALQSKVEKLKRDIGKYESELVTLRARARTATSMKKVNKQLAGVDTSGTIAMLEKMKTRVMEEESLAQAYGELTEASTGLDQKIDEVLEGGGEAKASDSLAALKSKMGIE